MKTFDNSARHMAKALLNHAKDIHNYAKTYCTPTSANQAITDKHKRTFICTARRMVNEMHALMLMADYKGVLSLCNSEQIEAYVYEASQAIASSVSDQQSKLILN